jgi:hypothetical protein
LLDRRNAAYVLLANSSWWALPWLSLQLLGGALLRSIGYLFAKLPGYASDELLAVASLLTRPKTLLNARKERKAHRFITSRVVRAFIPSRYKQLRSATTRTIEAIREKILPELPDDSLVVSELTINEDEDLLTPTQARPWTAVFARPMVAAATFIAVISLGWARHRLGALSGGALAQAPHSVSDLFKFYLESWHEVGMGSGLSTPPWLLFIATGSLLTFGNVPLFLALVFITAPFIFLITAHLYLKRFTDNSWLAAGAAFLYAMSPVSLAAVNSGRLGVIIFIALLPVFIAQLHGWNSIENRTWRAIAGHGLFLWVFFAFNPSVLLIVFVASVIAIYRDYLRAEKNHRDPLFIARTTKRALLVLIPFMLSVPASFEALIHPSYHFRDIGALLDGGGPTLAFFGNPGGPGSLPWWILSPISVLLFVTFFSTTAARRFSALGLTFLLSATFVSGLAVSGNGSATSHRIFSGTYLAIATLMAIVAGVVMFDKIRARLEQSNVNFRHISVAFVLVITIFYAVTSSFWLMTAGADSPVHTNTKKVLPAFLAIEKDVKTLVIRTYQVDDVKTLSYYISRSHNVMLGEPDVAPSETPIVKQAVEGLIDNTGVASSKVFSAFGIKYVFLKKPVDDQVVRTIDGIGGFSRTSATGAGIVWKVVTDTGRLRFTDYTGAPSILTSQGVRSRVTGAGTLTVTESFSRSWQVFEDGVRLPRVADAYGLPSFVVTNAGEISVIHDGTIRRAWISLFLIVLVTTVVFALPGGRRKSEISEEELA